VNWLSDSPLWKAVQLTGLSDSSTVAREVTTSWEKKIYHPGLKTFRIIKGNDPGIVELRAKLQLEAWDIRFQKIEQAAAKKAREEAAARINFQKKDLATNRTREAAERLSALGRILGDGIEIDHAFDWENLKDRSPFSEPQPQSPEPSFSPPAPIPNSPAFSPRLTFIDRLIPSRKARKIAYAGQEYIRAKEDWLETDRQLRDNNAKQQQQHNSAMKDWTSKKTLHAVRLVAQHAEVEASRKSYEAKEPDGLAEYWSQVLLASEDPDGFPKSFIVDYVAQTQTVVIEYELPDIECLPRLKELKYIAVKNELREVYVSDAWLNKTYDDVLYQVCLRTIYEVFQSDTVNAATSVVFNGWVNYIDKSTGQQVNACVLSLQVTKQEFSNLNLAQVEPKACFRSLKGVSGSRLASRSAVRPILQLNKEDKRFVASHEVAYELDDSYNLAAMDWLEFENLIREIFEKEFQSSGGEVKITRASRDGGVDAIAFDPDPIRGGKIVIQAKRYTNPVGVYAVRDLFGTVHNEGATKGILVTTSDYGPDAYEFAKGKPLTLLNGSELLYLLQKHGYHARIDIAEARRLAAEQGSGQ
jgi:restriction system protein